MRAGSILRLLVVLAAMAAVAAGLAGSAGAFGPARLSTGPAGIVRPLGGSIAPFHSTAAQRGAGQVLLTYHGGPVMRTQTAYAIYWLPSGSGLSFGGNNANYESTINQFFTDVGHDSGGTANVFGIDTQYYDTLSGGQTHIAYNTTFGGSVVATDPLPSQQCSDGWSGDTYCVTDAQLQAEITSVVNAQHWSEDSSHMYFIFTPQGLGSCYGSDCSYASYCAYHDDFFPNGGTGPIVYANMPWTESPYDCDEGQYPNGSAADPTINVLSHEFNEAITDAEPSTALAWIDSGGQEIGDKCAWTFGSLSGSNGAEYNQTINGHHYFLQLEFDNSSDACQQHPAAAAAPTISSFTPSSGASGAAVTINGSNFTGATSVKFNGTSQPTYTIVSTSKITTTVPAGATTGKISVITGGGTATSSGTFTVIVPPSISSFTPSGKDGAAVTINGSGFTGATAVKFNGKTASFKVVSDAQITTTVPSGATSGTITVTTSKGTATSSSSFLVVPSISSFSPSHGKVGTSVTINGSGFTGATSVKFNGTAATPFTVNSDSKITVKVPSGATSGTITVTTSGGTATSSTSYTVG
ncbi:MAG TPA: IPT/TIG domain-containing protein [Gaiellaceae bacterium]|nr:IPT/TIG domain-containing protein [Gaiellaceae bacterium]